MADLQAICRDYMHRLSHVAERHGLGVWLKDLIKANTKGECAATEDEAELLARMCDDERVSRRDIPEMLGKSYRRCVEDEDFENVKKLRHVGIYSKVSTLLMKKKEK